MKPILANNTKGCLITDFDGRTYFRVYSKPGEFIDYKIAHSDLSVTITDMDAYFYDNDILDHSPQTLGIKK